MLHSFLMNDLFMQRNITDNSTVDLNDLNYSLGKAIAGMYWFGELLRARLYLSR